MFETTAYVPTGIAYKIMPVKVHRMSGLVFSVHYDSDSLVAAIVVDVPLRIWIGVVLFIGKEQYRVVVVGPLSLIVHDPDVMTRAIRQQVNFDGLNHSWIWNCCYGIKWSCLSKIVLEKHQRMFDSNR